jgi:uncharacterized phiE125 gp8 family phage protein
MALKVITPPTVEPVSLTEAKLHLRVDGAAEDTLIAGLIQAAREHIENVLTHCTLCTQTLEYVISQFPGGCEAIQLPRPPLQSVTSIKYTDSADVIHTMNAADYCVNTDGNPGLVTPAYELSWPSSSLAPSGAVRIRYVAGWGAAASVPQALKQAILLLVGHLYENRAVMVNSQVQGEMPFAVTALCGGYLCFMWGMED